MSLPPRSDWHNNERPATAVENAMAEGRASRVRREVAEIRAAAEQLKGEGRFEAEVAAFLTTRALMLERAGGEARYASTMRPAEDTVEERDMFPTAARSALLIARALLADRAGR
uniref:Uncharacterized protein n=1 Tax=Streptomyces sp. 14R-10 TaxID=1442159 RepID=W0FTH9_9ACTN|nr:hypothetical protein [Streptomyces sp. 14R-10]AHF46183.1 hypothetical protein pZL1.18c [Streptomyces sp. 14R-10]